MTEMLHVLQPDTLLERFAARSAGAMGKHKDFLALKGTQGQIEGQTAAKLENVNELVGFKCLHYSVTESNGFVEITINKKNTSQEISFGCRTIDGTALENKDYEKFNQEITMRARETEKKIKVQIVDNNEWEPDLDFYIELYDLSTMGGASQGNEEEEPKYTRLDGDDTRCKVTILDEDFPGTIGFECTNLQVLKSQERVEITIVRNEGSDGQISCTIQTESLNEQGNAGVAAVEFEDYIPRHEKVIFQNGENSKVISITLVNERVKQLGDNTKMLKVDEDDESRDEIEEMDEVLDVIFKVKIERAEPEGVKISKKNVCFVTIVQNDSVNKHEDEQLKLLNYFIQSKEPSWSQQFIAALSLGPVIDQDNLIVDEVSLGEALMHFATIGWKVLFALVPPPKMGGGIPAFLIALAFIGIVTAVVGEVATVLGCVAGLEPSVTAITLVAIGTSLPDTFASMVAAQ